MNEIIKGMANAAEAIQENFEELDGVPARLATVEQNIDLMSLDTVKKLYNPETTLVVNAIKGAWNDIIAHDNENPMTTYSIRVSGNRLGLAVVGKIDSGNGTVLLVDETGISTHKLINGSWS